MLLIWRGALAQGVACSRWKVSIFVGEAHFLCIKCPSAPTLRTLNCTKERAGGENILRGVVLPLPGIAVYSMYTRSRLQSAREGHLTIMKYIMPRLV